MDDQPLTTAQLVVDASHGSRRAWRLLYDRFRPQRIALENQWLASEKRHLRDEVAGDIGEAFATAVHVAAAGNPNAFAGYFRTYAKNVVLKRRALTSYPMSIPDSTLSSFHSATEPPKTRARMRTYRAVARALNPALDVAARDEAIA